MLTCFCLQVWFRRSGAFPSKADTVRSMLEDVGPEVLLTEPGLDERGSNWINVDDFLSEFYIRRYGLPSYVKCVVSVVLVYFASPTAWLLKLLTSVCVPSKAWLAVRMPL